MANSFITIKSIARQMLPRLVENLVMPELVWSLTPLSNVLAKVVKLLFEVSNTFIALLVFS